MNTLSYHSYWRIFTYDGLNIFTPLLPQLYPNPSCFSNYTTLCHLFPFDDQFWLPKYYWQHAQPLEFGYTLRENWLSLSLKLTNVNSSLASSATYPCSGKHYEFLGTVGTVSRRHRFLIFHNFFLYSSCLSFIFHRAWVLKTKYMVHMFHVNWEFSSCRCLCQSLHQITYLLRWGLRDVLFYR